MRFFSFGGTTECTGADMYHFDDCYVYFGAGFIKINGTHLFGGNLFVLVTYFLFGGNHLFDVKIIHFGGSLIGSL